MTKAILVLDDIPEEYFAETISIKYELIYYPDGHMKELGRHGKRRLRPMPEKRITDLTTTVEYASGFDTGWNCCIDEILRDTTRDCKTCGHSNDGKCAYTEECHECMWVNNYIEADTGDTK